MCRKIIDKFNFYENYDIAAWKLIYFFDYFGKVFKIFIQLGSHLYTQLECFAELDIG